jgi:hypothetical protein
MTDKITHSDIVNPYTLPHRQNKLTIEVCQKMEEAAMLDCDVSELCLLAGISRDTYYRWMKEVPALSDRLDDLRQSPFLAARRRLVSDAEKTFDNAMRYMERKKPKEFMPVSKTEHAGKMEIEHSVIDQAFRAKADEAKARYEADLRKLYEAPEEETPMAEPLHENAMQQVQPDQGGESISTTGT